MSIETRLACEGIKLGSYALASLWQWSRCSTQWCVSGSLDAASELMGCIFLIAKAVKYHPDFYQPGHAHQTRFKAKSLQIKMTSVHWGKFKTLVLSETQFWHYFKIHRLFKCSKYAVMWWCLGTFDWLHSSETIFVHIEWESILSWKIYRLSF